jgi:NitT/TauT family transport system substrate-binding protein
MIRSAGTVVIAALAALATLVSGAAAQDKVKVGVFPVSSTLPYFVAVERGFFKEQNIETEMVRLIGGPPNVAAMITNQIDAAAVLVTIEGMNANIKKPRWVSRTATTRSTSSTWASMST